MTTADLPLLTEKRAARLLRPQEVAERLGCTVKTLFGHVHDGSLRYVNVGRGEIRPRYMFAESDLAEFEEVRRRRNAGAVVCRSTTQKVRRSTISISDGEVIAFHGSTKATSKREAQKVEAAEREKSKQRVAKMEAARTSLRLDDVAGRYWIEVGQHHKRSDNTGHMIGLLIGFFGKDKEVTDITDDDVSKLVAWRRGHQARPGGPLLSPFTVNDTTKKLKKLFNRAKIWGVRFDHEPHWRQHLLKEPQERVRELREDEAERLAAVTREDLAPFFAFAMASGMRLSECLLRWSEVDWQNRHIRKQGKGGRWVTVALTPTIRDILWPLRGHHQEFVFTFVAKRTGPVKGRVRGERYRLRHQAAARDRQSQAGAARAQPCRYCDHGALCACIGR
jgi:excisionase family DNA binding protein